MAQKTRYVVGGSDGWLNVKREPAGTIVALAQHIRVALDAQRDGRDSFTVLEGPERGGKFSVKAGHLAEAAPAYKGPVHLVFHVTRESLVFPSGTARAITHPRNPIALGAHPVQLPDAPHAGGHFYVAGSPYAKTWFYLGHGAAVRGNNDRYLHPGSVSAGCVTVDPADWTALYRHLILCRRGDDKTIGTLTVAR